MFRSRLLSKRFLQNLKYDARNLVFQKPSLEKYIYIYFFYLYCNIKFNCLFLYQYYKYRKTIIAIIKVTGIYKKMDMAYRI